MLIEHIQRGRYIIDFTDGEYNTLKQVATGFHKGNLCTTIRQIYEGGIAVYNELLEMGFAHDKEFESSVKVLAEHLIEQEEKQEKGRWKDTAIDSRD